VPSPLTPYGRREWIAISALCAAAGGACIILLPWWTIFLVAVVWLALVSFFRDPVRRIPADLPPGTMLSPADGTISAILRVNEHPATDGHPAVIIRVLLTVLNVHVNRTPCDGDVIDVRHTPGRFMSAMKPESADVNESNLVRIRVPRDDDADADDTLAVKQIAGRVARRIVCRLAPGDHVRQGDTFGMIKFGSTTELILPRPDDVEVRVAPGQRVRAGTTTLAVMRPPAATHASDSGDSANVRSVPAG